MHYQKSTLTLLAMLVGATVYGQLDIHNSAHAGAYNPTSDDHEENYLDPMVWDTVRDSNVSALSAHHPFDPPINIATSMSHFNQSQYGNATIRSSSFVISDYSGIGSNIGYDARTEFTIHQTLQVTTGSWSSPQGHLRMVVPMHGRMAARGFPVGQFLSIASAEMHTTVSANNSMLDSLDGALTLVGNDYNVFNWQSSGCWDGSVSETTVDLPTGNQPRSSQGIELADLSLMNLGLVQQNMTYTYQYDYTMLTSALIWSPNSSFALADFSGTGEINFSIVDDAGADITDFAVTPGFSTVPEPGSVMAIGFGLVTLAARRRKRS